MTRVLRKPKPKLPDPIATPTLTVEETAKVLRVSKSCVYEGIRGGTIPAIRVTARGTRVPTAKLLAMLGLGLENAA